MTRKHFALLVAALVVVAGVLYGSGAMGTLAEAGSKDHTYRWLAGTGMTELGFLCNLGGPPCPDAAVASSGVIGDTIELTGEGTFVVRETDGRLEPQDGGMAATGGGSFTHYAADGTVLGTGTWMVKRLVSFVSFGDSVSVGLPERWEAGDAVFEVELMGDDHTRGVGEKRGGVRLDAVLRVACILDPADPDLPADAIENINIDVPGLGNFDMPPAVDPDRSTLFIRLD